MRAAGSPLHLICLALVVLVVTAAVLAPWLVPHDPNVVDLGSALAGTSADHPLGVDAAGRDTLSRLLLGARTSLLGPLEVVAFSTLAGVAVGTAAAWRGGRLDSLLSRSTELVFAFPGMLLAILIISVYGEGLLAPVIALAIAYLPSASEVIWFDGVYGQDITDDHVDATSRFLAEGEALVQMPLASDNDAYAKDARQQHRVLTASTTATGRPMDVMKLQGPDYDRIRSTDPDFLASYASYYLCNGAVVCGQFGDAAADAAAKGVLARLHPGRTVEQLNIDRLGAGGGGIHCVTQQQPVP
ncbi:agmatine deiminase family protein [Streptomyces sp. NPDC047917]|uniref:agmatine deiminase family protein n=1 Tax=Streptomyces sp. NPDC047917 TaxID=3365491 RepID=UPI0037219585